MKRILRNTLLYAFALYLLTSAISGVKVTDGMQTYLFGGFVLALLAIVVKPILHLLSMPLNMLTLGAFSVITNLVILYLLTIFVPNITIHAFTFHKVSILGIILPTVQLNHFWAFITTAFYLSAIVGLIDWLFVHE